MQVRRWWYSVMVAMILGAAQAASGQPVPGPGTNPADLKAYMEAAASRMQAATPAEAVDVRERIVSGAAGLDATGKAAYSAAVRAAFAPLIKSDRQPVSINATATIALLGSMNSDRVLEDALTDSRPAIRFWAARGLGPVLKNLTLIQADFDKAQTSLTTALSTETEPLVGAAICAALGEAADQRALPAVVSYLGRLSKALDAKAPPAGGLVAATEAIRAIGALKAKAPMEAAEQKAAADAVKEAVRVAEQHSGEQSSKLSKDEYARLLETLREVATQTLGGLAAK